MPIDYRNYPENWLSEIRPRILARENHCCKFCGIANRLLGWRVPGGRFYSAEQWEAGYIPVDDEDALVKVMAKKPQPYRIILTVAHLDHGLSNHDDDNLAALCQRCHLNHDRATVAIKRQQNRRYSKRKKQYHLPLLELADLPAL